MSDFTDLVHDPKCKPRFEMLLRLAARRGDAQQVAERLSWGIDPNGESKKGRTPLICNLISSSPSAAVVEALLKAGANPHHVDHKGHTALDYANRKLARLNLRPRRPPRKSSSLDENDQIILAPFEQEMLDEVRRDHPEWAKDFVNTYMKERIKAAKRVFNDPEQIERIIDLLEAAINGRK
jgi:ankyrin repeat protein